MVCLVVCIPDRRRRAAVQIQGKPLTMLLLEQQLLVSDV